LKHRGANVRHRGRPARFWETINGEGSFFTGFRKSSGPLLVCMLFAKFVERIEVFACDHIFGGLGRREFKNSDCLDAALPHDPFRGFPTLHPTPTKFFEDHYDLGKIRLESCHVIHIWNGIYDQESFRANASKYPHTANQCIEKYFSNNLIKIITYEYLIVKYRIFQQRFDAFALVKIKCGEFSCFFCLERRLTGGCLRPCGGGWMKKGLTSN
jgi:hypothetical protein